MLKTYEVVVEFEHPDLEKQFLQELKYNTDVNDDGILVREIKDITEGSRKVF